LGNIHPELGEVRLFVFLDRQRRWIKVSAEFASLLGYAEEELIGKTAAELLPRGVKDRPGLFAQLLRDQTLEADYVLSDRAGLPVAIQTKAQVLDDGCILALIQRIKY
jgi:PAS domain-containing protein